MALSIVSYNQRKGDSNVELRLRLGSFSCIGSANIEVFISHAVLTFVRDEQVQAVETGFRSMAAKS